MQGTQVKGLKHHYIIILVCKTNVSKLSGVYYWMYADHLKLICSRSRSCSALQHVSTEPSSSFRSACLQAEAAQNSCWSGVRGSRW